MQGKTINDYTLQHLIGRGGMAEVWYAENSIEKAAAVKILRDDFAHNPDIVERFRNEAKVMVKLNHPNIRQVYGYGDVDGRPAIIMEYLEGDDLKARMKHGERFSEQQLEKWWNQMADALNYTHGEGVVHRDIKPSNIFIDTKGNVRLLDFGIAKVKESISSTQTGAAMGTLLYMSPEQIDDVKRVDYRTDVYSLAVTFVHLLTGKAPYDATTTSDYQIRKSIVEKPLDLSALPAAWRGLLQPYLAKDREQRPALAHFSEPAKAPDDTDKTIIDKPQPKPEPNPKPRKKCPIIAGAAAVALMVLVVLLTMQTNSKAPKNREALKSIIAERIEKYGPNCNLNDIDVSKVTEMDSLFFESQFNGDISKWNVSNVTDMQAMFYHSQFNGDISKWNVSNVTNMKDMFFGSQFNGDISKWDVSNVTDMDSLFFESQFNGDISKWDVSNVTNMGCMFADSQFNGDISKWDVSKVTDMSGLFFGSQFNGDISKWDVSNVTDMTGMFNSSQFNGDISKWDVSNVTDMRCMFYLSPFNGDISKWDVSKVTNMGNMFWKSKFNGDISQWNVSNVTDMSWMFWASEFNGDISQWNVSNVTDMSLMFSNSQFNGDISKWNVSKVTYMSEMFYESQFNGDISQWNVSKVTYMSEMFKDSPLEGREPSWYRK